MTYAICDVVCDCHNHNKLYTSTYRGLGLLELLLALLAVLLDLLGGFVLGLLQATVLACRVNSTVVIQQYSIIPKPKTQHPKHKRYHILCLYCVW